MVITLTEIESLKPWPSTVGVTIRDGQILIFCRIPDSDIRHLQSGFSPIGF